MFYLFINKKKRGSQIFNSSYQQNADSTISIFRLYHVPFFFFLLILNNEAVVLQLYARTVI